jgi:hypothetical protein
MGAKASLLLYRCAAKRAKWLDLIPWNANSKHHLTTQSSAIFSTWSSSQWPTVNVVVNRCLPQMQTLHFYCLDVLAKGKSDCWIWSHETLAPNVHLSANIRRGMLFILCTCSSGGKQSIYVFVSFRHSYTLLLFFHIDVPPKGESDSSWSHKMPVPNAISVLSARNGFIFLFGTPSGGKQSIYVFVYFWRSYTLLFYCIDVPPKG